LAFYTIGQRKGLEIGGGFGTSGAPWFVADKRLESNELSLFIFNGLMLSFTSFYNSTTQARSALVCC
jgi:tRNA-specific 2-thiouridylase